MKKHIGLEAPYTATTFHAFQLALAQSQGRLVCPPTLSVEPWQVIAEGEAYASISSSRRKVINDLTGNDFSVLASPGQWVVVGGVGQIQRTPSKKSLAFSALGQTLGAGDFRDTAHAPFLAEDVGRMILVPTAPEAGLRKITAFTDASNVACDTSILGAFGASSDVLYTKMDRMESYGIYPIESVQSASVLTLDATRPIYGGAAAFRYALVSPLELAVGPFTFEQQGIVVEEEATQYVPYPEDAFDESFPYLYLVASVIDSSPWTGSTLRIVRHLQDLGQSVLIAVGYAPGMGKPSFWWPAHTTSWLTLESSVDASKTSPRVLTEEALSFPKTRTVRADYTDGFPEKPFLKTAGEHIVAEVATTPPKVGVREDVLFARNKGRYHLPVLRRNWLSSLTTQASPTIDPTLRGLQPLQQAAANVATISPVKASHVTLVNRHGIRLTVAIDNVSGDLLFRAYPSDWGLPVHAWTQAAIDLGASSLDGFVDKQGGFVLGWIEDIAGTDTFYSMRIAPSGIDVAHSAFAVSAHNVDLIRLCHAGENRVLYAWRNTGDNHAYWKSLWLREDSTETTLIAEEDVSGVAVLGLGACAKPVQRTSCLMFASASSITFLERNEFTPPGSWDTQTTGLLDTPAGELDLSTLQGLRGICSPDESVRFFALSGVSNGVMGAMRMAFTWSTWDALWKPSNLAMFSATAELDSVLQDGNWHVIQVIRDSSVLSLFAADVHTGATVGYHGRACFNALHGAFAIHPETGEGILTRVFTDGVTTNGLAEDSFSIGPLKEGIDDEGGFVHGESSTTPIFRIENTSSREPFLHGKAMLLAVDATPASTTLLETGAGVLEDGSKLTFVTVGPQYSIGMQLAQERFAGFLLVDEQDSHGFDKGVALDQSFQVWTSNDNATWTQRTILRADRLNGKTFVSVAEVTARFAKIRFLASLQVAVSDGSTNHRDAWRITGLFAFSNEGYAATGLIGRSMEAASQARYVSSWEELQHALSESMRRMPSTQSPKEKSMIILRAGYHAAWTPLVLPSHVDVVFETGAWIDPIACVRGLPLIIIQGESYAVSSFLGDFHLYLDAPVSAMAKEGDRLTLSDGINSFSTEIVSIDRSGQILSLRDKNTLPTGSLTATIHRSFSSIHGLSCIPREIASVSVISIGFSKNIRVQQVSFSDNGSTPHTGKGVFIFDSEAISIVDTEAYLSQGANAFHVQDTTLVRLHRCKGMARLRGLYATRTSFEETAACLFEASGSGEKDVEILSPTAEGPLGDMRLDPLKGFYGFDVPLNAIQFQDFGRVHVRRDLLAGVLNNGAYEWMHAYTLALVQGLHGLSLITLPYGWVDSLVSDAILDALLSS